MSRLTGILVVQREHFQGILSVLPVLVYLLLPIGFENQPTRCPLVNASVPVNNWLLRCSLETSCDAATYCTPAYDYSMHTLCVRASLWLGLFREYFLSVIPPKAVQDKRESLLSDTYCLCLRDTFPSQLNKEISLLH